MNIASLDLRQAVLHNMHGSSEADVRHTITDAIQSGEEKMLPGLGVLLEVFWKNSSVDEQNRFVTIVQQNV